MTKTNFKKSFIEITAALFVLLYLYTGLTKAMHNGEFNAAMKHSPLIALFSEQLAIIIPVIEIIISILLIIPQTRFNGMLFATALMALFTFYVIYIMTADRALPCTCGGIIQQMGWRDHLILNSSFLLSGITATLLHFHKDFHRDKTGEAEYL